MLGGSTASTPKCSDGVKFLCKHKWGHFQHLALKEHLNVQYRHLLRHVFQPLLILKGVHRSSRVLYLHVKIAQRVCLALARPLQTFEARARGARVRGARLLRVKRREGTGDLRGVS